MARFSAVGKWPTPEDRVFSSKVTNKFHGGDIRGTVLTWLDARVWGGVQHQILTVVCPYAALLESGCAMASSDWRSAFTPRKASQAAPTIMRAAPPRYP